MKFLLLQQRIAQLRQNRLLSLPHLLPTAADVHSKHLAASEISAREKRELLLQQNRQRMAALQHKSANPAAALPKQQEMLHLSEDLLVKIVDINLPGSAAARTTFEPAPLAQTAQQRKEQKRREAEIELSGSSHRGVAGSSLIRGAPTGSAAASASASAGSRITPQEGAREFSRAMASIKQLPQMGRAQMDAYKGLLEDWLSTQPYDPALAQPVAPIKEPPPEEPRDTVVLPGLDLSGKAKQQEQQEREDPDAAPRSQSPHLYSKAPNVNIKRRKKPAGAGDAAASSAGAADASSAAAAPAAAALPTVGGVSYDPRTLVQSTGLSMHGAKGAQQPQQSQADSMEDLSTPAGSEDSSEYVYDVYHLPDEETGSALPSDAAAASSPNPAAVGGAGPQHHHGSSTSVPFSTLTGLSSHGDEYKASYDGVSSAYVVLHDGVLEWINPSGRDDLVQEDELAMEDEGDYDDEDPDGQEIDYSDDQDSSAEEEHEDRQTHAHAFDDPDDVPFAGAGGATQRDGPLTMLTAQQFHSLRQMKQGAQRAHGFYPDGPHDAEAETDDVEDGQCSN